MPGIMTEEQKKLEAMRLKDAEILERRKKKFDTARFAHIENTNKVMGAPKPQESAKPLDWKKESETKKEEAKKKGWRIFKKKDKDSGNELVKESTDPYKLEPPPPIAAKSERPDGIPVEMAPNWAGVDIANQKPQPDYGHSSDASFPRLPNTGKVVSHKPENPRPKPDPNKKMYGTAEYGAKGMKPSSNLSSTIAAFQGGFKPLAGKPRAMKKEKVDSTFFLEYSNSIQFNSIICII